MEGLARQEYPGMLASLPPSQAVNIFSERVKRVGKLNAEIADWLQERRKVEDLYVQGLKKLARRPLPDSTSELGVFHAPWSQIVAWVDETATSHAILSKGIEKDVEQALRQFPTKNKEMASVLTIQGHLAQMAKEYESAQDTVDKLAKKGPKANQAKSQQATQKLSTVTSEWESQAPFIFEKLQAIDETRLNHLRDVLTQFETHEMDQVERNKVLTEAALTSLLEVDTAVEILNFATNATQGKPKLERRATAARTGSTVSASSANLALPPPRMPTEDSSSMHSARNDASSEHKKETGDGALFDSATAQPPPQLDGTGSNATQLDADGFTVPPAANDAISQAQREANSENDATPAFKLNIAQQAIQEEDADAKAALSSVANTLRSVNLPAPTRKVGTVRGRRDVRNSMYIPGPEVAITDAQRSPGVNISAPPAGSQGIGRAANLAASASDLGSSADSIRSSTSAGGGHIKHPEMTRPGINASVIETVNLLSENGEIKTATVIGEIALSYVHPVSSPEILDTASIRLFNFAGLEAIAPNKAFLTESTSPDHRGEYTVQLSEIKRTNCAFKYKVHTEPSNLNSHIPLLIKPTWKPTGDKLGVVVEYSLNPAYSSQSLTLSNVTLIVSYEGAKAISAQTRPSGTHVKEKNLVFWRLGDVLLEPGSTKKVLGRLLGEQGKQILPGVVEAKWEIAVPAGSLLGSGIGVGWKTGSVEEVEGKGKGPESPEPDPFADEDAAKGADSGEGDGWTVVESVRKIVSGKYDAITGADQA
ncbi:Suppressor of profilin deletion [Pseudogymnoascus australis]